MDEFTNGALQYEIQCSIKFNNFADLFHNREWNQPALYNHFETLFDEPVHLWVSYSVASSDSESEPEEVTHWMLLYMEVQEAIEEVNSEVLGKARCGIFFPLNRL